MGDWLKICPWVASRAASAADTTTACRRERQPPVCRSTHLTNRKISWYSPCPIAARRDPVERMLPLAELDSRYCSHARADIPLPCMRSVALRTKRRARLAKERAALRSAADLAPLSSGDARRSWRQLRTMDMVGESATSPTSPSRTCASTFSSADGIAPADAGADARAEAAHAARTSASDAEKRTARAFPGVRRAAPSRLDSLHRAHVRSESCRC